MSIQPLTKETTAILISVLFLILGFVALKIARTMMGIEDE